MNNGAAVRASSRWYRDRWPWILMAGPAIVVVAGCYSAWLAVHTDDGLVVDDYYKRGLAINQSLDRSDRASALKLGAVVDIAADGAVRVLLSGDGGADAAPAAIRLRLAHPTRAGLDRNAVLIRGTDDVYVTRLAPPPTGRWLVILETDAWRLPAVEVAATSDPIRLGVAAAP